MKFSTVEIAVWFKPWSFTNWKINYSFRLNTKCAQLESVFLLMRQQNFHHIKIFAILEFAKYFGNFLIFIFYYQLCRSSHWHNVYIGLESSLIKSN